MQQLYIRMLAPNKAITLPSFSVSNVSMIVTNGHPSVIGQPTRLFLPSLAQLRDQVYADLLLNYILLQSVAYLRNISTLTRSTLISMQWQLDRNFYPRFCLEYVASLLYVPRYPPQAVTVALYFNRFAKLASGLNVTTDVFCAIIMAVGALNVKTIAKLWLVRCSS